MSFLLKSDFSRDEKRAEKKSIAFGRIFRDVVGITPGDSLVLLS